MPTPEHPFETALDDLVRVLDGLPYPYCLLGALALGAWGTPRTTQDIDILLSAEGPDRQRLVGDLGKRGFAPDLEWVEHNPMIREYHLRLRRKVIALDLLFPRNAHDREVLARRRRQKLGNQTLWVVSPEDLILHKLKAGRAQDFVDVLSVFQHQKGMLDEGYLSGWAERLGILEELAYCQQQLSESGD